MLEVFNTQFWCDIVWALLHSIWQAAIIALLLGAILRQISAKQATLRYWLAVSAILSLVLTSFFTYHVRTEFRKSSASPNAQQTSTTSSFTTATHLSAAETENISSSPSSTAIEIDWTALAALLWVVGVSLMVMRTIGAVFFGNQFSSTTPIDSPKYLELLKAEAQKIGLRKVPSFWSSAYSGTPYAVGVLAPTVVVPLSMLTSLSSSELQAVLAHELAHIRRNDYLANLFQMVIEAVYFFNPAVWWISRQIRVEREACCDQIAIESAGNNIGYATILASWMETVAGGSDSTLAGAPATALAFSNKQPSGMLERIQRILKPESKPRLQVSPLNWVFVIAVSLLIACAMNVGSKAVTTVAAQALSDSERVARIEEKQDAVDKHAEGVFEKGWTTIGGRITTEDGGEVEGGRLYSKSTNRESSTRKTELSFVTGQEFDISVNSGVVWLELFSKNYAPAIVGPIKALKDQSISQDVTLVKGAPHLIHVVDAQGQPVSGANVQMLPKSNGGPVWKTSTDDLGNYTFQHRNPGGESNLSVEKVGYIKKRMVVTNDGKTEVVLETAPISKGVVVSADGTPVANAEIRLVADKGLFFNNKLAATTDEQGRFETPMLFPAGVYDILVASDSGMVVVDNVTADDNLKFTLGPACSMDITIKGDLDQLDRRKNGKLEISFDQEEGRAYWLSDFGDGLLEVVEDSEDQVRLKLKRLFLGAFTLRSGKFRHAVTAKPGNHSVEVIASAASNKTANGVEKAELEITFECEGATVKPSGSLHLGVPSYDSFSPLVDGQIKVSVEPGRCHLTPSRLIGFTFEQQVIEVKAGEVNEVTIEVEPAGAVSGRLVDANGEPVSASVSCRYTYQRPGSYHSSGLTNHFRSDDKGNFLLTPIPLGAKVVVKGGDRFNPAVSDELLIEASNPVVDVQLQTAAPAKAMVRVIDHQGKPMPGVDLSIELTSHGGWGGDLSTDAKGEKEISPLHPTWDYTVSAKPKKGFVANTVDVVQGETTVVQLEPGCVLRGQLLDSDENPVSNQRVYALYKDPHSPHGPQTWIDADRRTDFDGRFEFTRLPRTECEINSHGAESILVNAGLEDEPIELLLED